MKKLRVLDLFSGIGGFSLGLERTGGFETVAFCEIEEFPRKVLAKHWPGVPIYHDVRELTAAKLAADGITVDVITGGFPCQDISIAGKRAGIGEGTRSGLWSEIVRLVRELRPRYIVVENVADLLTGPTEQPGRWFGRVLGDLAELRYDAEWENIPAASVGLASLRKRVWIIAYPNENEHQAGLVDIRHLRASGRSQRSHEQGREEQEREWLWFDLPRGREKEAGAAWVDWVVGRYGGAADLVRKGDELPGWLDRDAALGNAVAPQIPEVLGRAILEAEQ